MQVLRARDYRRMPWKNGGGETREVLASPIGARLDAIDWRISLATIASNGPFSVFNGIERTLCVIRGEGIQLQVGDASPALLRPNTAPFTFDGEAPASAALVDGAIVDLNVMTRRARFRHSVTRRKVEGCVQLRISTDTIVFCERGTLRCNANETSSDLEPEDCAVIAAGSSPLQLSVAEPATILIIEILSAR
jgi:environmental stress-induced protein Ves